MKAMLLKKYGERLELGEIPAPLPAPGELLVAVKASGLCGTDLKIIQGKLQIGPLPHILGHEIAGVVTGCGSGAHREWIGKHVILHLYNACGCCEPCAEGAYNMCDDLHGRLGFERPGGLAESIVCPVTSAVAIPENIPFAEACIAPCALLTIYHAIRRAGVTAGDRVALLGSGGLALHGVQLLAGMGAQVTAVDLYEEKLALAKKLGASGVLPFVAFMAGSERYSVLIDTVGNPEIARTCFKNKLERRGRYIMISFTPGTETSFDSQSMAMDELQVIGIRNGTIHELRELIALQAAGKIKPVIDRTFPLEKANDALDLLRSGKLMGRVVITHQAG